MSKLLENFNFPHSPFIIHLPTVYLTVIDKLQKTSFSCIILNTVSFRIRTLLMRKRYCIITYFISF